jgi:hypothetical protein
MAFPHAMVVIKEDFKVNGRMLIRKEPHGQVIVDLPSKRRAESAPVESADR